MIKLVLRMPEEIHEGIKATAKKNLRSLNSEIIAAIRQYLQIENRRTDEATFQRSEDEKISSQD